MPDATFDLSKRYWLFYGTGVGAEGIGDLIGSFDSIQDAITDRRAAIDDNWSIPYGHVLDMETKKIVAYIAEGGYRQYVTSKRESSCFYRDAFWITINDKKWNIELYNLVNDWAYKCLV